MKGFVGWWSMRAQAGGVFAFGASTLIAFAPALQTLDKPVTYAVSDLGPLPSRVDVNFQLAEDGTVVGCYRTDEGRTRAAVWRQKQRVDLESPPGFHEGIATGMTESGEIVGFVFDASDDRKRHAVLWRSGKPEFLDAEKSLNVDNGENTVALGASRKIVVGQSQTSDGKAEAVFWRNGVRAALGVLEKGDSSAATDVNERGNIVGYSNLVPHGKNRAFLRENGKMTELQPISGGDTAQARALNNIGQAVGWSDASGEGLHATLWRNGKPVDLGTLGDEPSAAYDIADNGDIVGGSSVNERTYHAFLHRNGKMIDLNSLLPKDSGWTLRQAQSINNRREIVGIGSHNRERRAFLLTPQ